MARTKKFQKLTDVEKEMNYIKANRKGSRDAELENESGFVAAHKVHKSKKAYNRKSKYQEMWGE